MNEKDALCPSTPPSDASRRIVVLAQGLRAGGGLLVGQNLVSALVRVGRRHQYCLVLPAGVGYESLGLEGAGAAVHYHRRRGGHAGRWAFDNLILPGLVRRFRPELVFALGNKSLVHPPCRQVLLCQDSHLFYPPRHFPFEPPVNRLLFGYLRRHLARSLRRTDLLLAQTPVARDRLVSTYGYRGATALCPNALSVEAFGSPDAGPPPSPLAAFAGRRKLFCLARYYPHKNLESIVETYRRYRRELAGTVAVLTIAPEQHRLARRLLDSIAREGLGDLVINVGPLSQEEIARYYRHCDALLLPTLLESFTRTYFEAMHFGVPVLTSDLDFAREICCGAAVYFDPWRPESIRDAILRLEDRPLVQRIVEEGRSRLAQAESSWDAIAAGVLAAAESLFTPCRQRPLRHAA